MIKAPTSQPIGHHGFSPYTNNGGTVLAVAGKGYCIVAADTRLSNGGYSINSRNVSKLHSLTDITVMGSSGMNADAVALRKHLDMSVVQFHYDNNKDMTTNSAAQLLSNTLYYKRFFPFYTFNLLCGLDSEGNGMVHNYDAIGSFERVPYACVGSSMALVTPLLDSQVGFLSQKKNFRELKLEEALNVVKDAMNVAGERDIYTGDSMDVWIITKGGTQKANFPLKKD